MLSNLFAYVLNSYIGEYFGNVNTDQLSYVLINGEFELEGLPLRSDALKHLALPLEIINGFIGKIKLKIPVYHLKSEPWVISIDELFLIGRPITDFSYNEEIEERNEQNQKISQLDLTESRWKAIHNADDKESQSYYASSYFSWHNYGSTFVNNIVENVQLKIRSVHIRYEDSSTIAGIPFAAGIIIKNLSAHSIDENWVPKYVTRDNSEYLRKLIELEGLSAYWDTNTQLFSHLDLPEVVKLMRSHLDRSSDINGMPIDHDYILAPVSGKAYFKRNCSEKPLKSRSVPRNVIDLQLDQVPVLLTAIQYKHLMEWSIAFNRANIRWKYRKWRPTVPISGNSKLWWKFAIDSNLHPFREKRRRRDWEFILKRGRDIVEYCDVYYVHLLHPESLTREMRLIKERIEYDLSFEEICCLREIVFSKCDRNQQNSEPPPTDGHYLSLNYWFPNWYDTSAGSKLVANDEVNSNPDSEDINEEVIDSPKVNGLQKHNSLENLTKITNIDDIFVTRDAVFGQLNFSIKNASFALKTFSDNPSSPTFTSEKLTNNLMEFEFSNVKIGVEICNSSLCNDENNIYTDLISYNRPKTNQLSNESSIQFNLFFECHYINVRVSYNDILMFWDIFNSLSYNLYINFNLLFECHYLNLVLLRTKSAIITDNDASKLATASLNGCQITIKVGSNEIGIEGQLDSLQVLDLVTDQISNKHKRVVSIGRETPLNESFSEAKIDTILESSDEKALKLSIRRLISENVLKVNIEMASLLYVHSNRLVYELTLCSQNLKKYMTVFSERVKAAATEVALGMVTKTKTTINSRLKSSGHFIENFDLKIYLRTPVIILPTSPSSYEVMVSHLGRISINHFRDGSQRNHVITAEIRDLSVYSLDCSKNIKKGNHLMGLCVEELYSCEPFGISILQETIIEISVEKKKIVPKFEKSAEECGLNTVTAVSDVTDLTANKFTIISAKPQNSHKELVLTFDIPNINVRVSYNDILMFWHIFNSLSYNSYNNFNHSSEDKQRNLSTDNTTLSSSVRQLEILGFATEDCIRALDICNGNISESALWLTRNARHPKSYKIPENLNPVVNSRSQNQSIYSKFSVIEVRIQNGTLCLIDDCNETDVPLLELNTKDFRLMQHNSDQLKEGFSQMAFSCDYFNSALSGWEPFIENCKFQLSWKVIERPFHIKTLDSHTKKIAFQFEVKELININISSNFAELIKTVTDSWIKDIKDFMNMSASKRAFRHRTPFIPYAIKNETGCPLKFHLIKDIKKPETCAQKVLNSNTKWTSVAPNEVFPFSFDSISNVSSKARHSDSHLEKTHKIIVTVDGWKSVFPVTINRVGIYFREAESEIFINQTARIVFSIDLEPKARKLVTIRSALLISNQTSNAIELKFQNTNESLYINSNATLPVPLRLVRNKIQVRPCDVGVNICQTPLNWEHVRRCGETSSELQICTPLTVTRNQHSSYSTASSYRYCVLVERNRFPLDIGGQGPGLQSYRAQPAHTITLVPPLKLTNLLPYELRFHVSDTSVIGMIKPGEEISIHYANPLESFSMEFSMENFPECRPLVINPGATRDYVTHLDLLDNRKRLLILHALVTLVSGSTSALAINIYSPYWFINRTGLPIVVKQEGADEASGQLSEHEMARSISPLLFSFSEPDSAHMCSLRLGDSKGMNPRWSNPFLIEKGMYFLSLRVGATDLQKPEIVYEFGIDIRNGGDRYCDTKIVTITPRYQIENLSSYRLEFAQKCMTCVESTEHQSISILPKSNVAFHWPRTDRDRLLCVRIASIPNCFWSGGFAVEPSTSFYLNIRDKNRKSYFLLVEILIENATLFVVLTDANNLPPPIRVENFSHVPIEFYQTNTTHSYMKTFMRANTQLAYAWDELTQKPHITVRAPGGSCSSYDMMSLPPDDHLTYENFLYIAFTGTFGEEDSDDEKVLVVPLFKKDDSRNQLVFDVNENNKTVFLARKERGKRSQLWRMDNSKHVIHEGSSPPLDPNDPKKTNFHKTDKNVLVLDIANPCPLPGEYTPLMLRKIDAKRTLTQTWTFTADGRLCCEYPNLYVQPTDGPKGLRAGSHAVLGPNRSDLTNNTIPDEQRLSVKNMRKGSGVLTVSVLAEGPTRVLRINDIKNRERISSGGSHSTWMPEDRAIKRRGFLRNIELNFLFTIDSIGLSIINHFNEELLYIYFRNSIFDLTVNSEECQLNSSIQDLQVDNQLKGAEKAIVLHVNPAINSVQLPAISLTAQNQFIPNVETKVFKNFQISIKDMIFNLEEILLLKILEFINFDVVDNELDQINNRENAAANRAISSILAKSTRYYFTIFLIQLSQVKLSVFTTSHLPKIYNKLKKKLGIKLIRFEEANVQLSPFRKVYSLMTKNFLFDSIYSHYRAELKSQEAKILGSVDFLGNPLGFVNDVTDGINEFINQGNFGGLVWNVAHGMADSTVKVTTILSDGLGVVTMDQRHQEIRKRIKQENSHHLFTGIKGLRVGILGGVTSIITQTYEGAVKEGVSGVFTGLGKGLVGTITKPAVGMLDFATGAASAIRESSRKGSTHHNLSVERLRPPRVNSIKGLVLKYQLSQGRGQEFFNNSPIINDREESETFVALEVLHKNYSVLITSEKLRFVQTIDYNDYKIDSTLDFDKLDNCLVWINNLINKPSESYIVTIRTDSKSSDMSTAIRMCPKYLCESEDIAYKICDQINYAKHSHEERKYFITTS